MNAKEIEDLEERLYKGTDFLVKENTAETSLKYQKFRGANSSASCYDSFILMLEKTQMLTKGKKKAGATKKKTGGKAKKDGDGHDHDEDEDHTHDHHHDHDVDQDSQAEIDDVELLEHPGSFNYCELKANLISPYPSKLELHRIIIQAAFLGSKHGPPKE